MLLAVDVGNTQTVLGLYDGDRLTEQRRLATEASRTGDELGALLGEMLDLELVDGICLSSTVPALVREFELFAERWARSRYCSPCFAFDFGTATNFYVVAAEGEYVGGVLAPGIEISMDALFARAARLMRVDFTEPPTVIGKTTVHSLQSGLVYGFAGQVDRIVEEIRGELRAEAATVATGGLAELIVPHTRTIERVDRDLTLE